MVALSAEPVPAGRSGSVDTLGLSVSTPTCAEETARAARRPWTRPRWGRRGCVVVLLLLVVCLALWRQPILQGLAWILVVDQQPQQIDYVLIGGGDGCFDEAARLYRQRPSRRVLLMEPPPGRLVRLGILPTVESASRRALEARDVPPEVVEVIVWKAGDPTTRTQRLQAWMKDHPHVRTVYLCERFASRHVRCLLDWRLAPEAAAHIAVRGLPDRRFDETNWWRSRRGVKEWVLRSMALAHAWCRGEEDERGEDWDPDQYERSLRAERAEVAR